MKRWILSSIFLLAALWPSVAQNNPYEIDDACYAILQQAEAIVDDPAAEDFDALNQRLLDTAIERRDDKARTLHYVFALRRLCRVEENVPVDQRLQANKMVDDAYDLLKDVARETGFTQYYYYAYDLAQNYYFDSRQVSAAFDLLDLITVYPVEDENKYTDHFGRVLPDAFLIPRGSTARDLAYKVHTELGDKFIRAVNAKTKRTVGSDYILQDGDVIRIVANR